MAVLGFIGVGRMGGPMASRLLDAGHQLCIYDVSAEATAPFAARGATLAASPAEVASQAEIVLVSLPTRTSCAPSRWAEMPASSTARRYG